jgi:hypothetical protein
MITQRPLLGIGIVGNVGRLGGDHFQRLGVDEFPVSRLLVAIKEALSRQAKARPSGPGFVAVPVDRENGSYGWSNRGERR